MFAPILTTLGFVVQDDSVLLVHRTREGDDQQGKFNGLGGKLRADEDVVAGLRRELAEEAGIWATGVRFRGTVSWPGFSKSGDDVFGFVFVVDAWTGQPNQRSPEGPLSWHRISDLGMLPMWEGDRHFLPLVFDPNVEQFHGVLPYVGGKPQSWSASVLPAAANPALGLGADQPR